MDLNTITTVQDLVNQNQEPQKDTVDELLDTIQLDLDDTYELTKRLVQRLGSFHQSVIEDLKSDPEAIDQRDVWVRDERLLETVWVTLDEIQSRD